MNRFMSLAQLMSEVISVADRATERVPSLGNRFIVTGV